MAFKWRRKKQDKWFSTAVEKQGPPSKGKKAAGFVYHRGAGVVIPWHQCILVDVESCGDSNVDLWLDWLEYGDVNAARRLAELVGVPMDYLAIRVDGWYE
jgi:hypothetical protein